jgi:hypothetical protein
MHEEDLSGPNEKISISTVNLRHNKSQPYETTNPLKMFIKKLLGRYKDVPSVGQRARYFNNWLKDIENGWLSHYQLKNVVVFDYYDILTKNGVTVLPGEKVYKL